MSSISDARFKDAPWYEQCGREKIMFVGAGGIGSNALYNLTKTIPCNYYIVDHDTVEQHNIGTQFFTKEQIGKSKANCLYYTLVNFGSNAFISTHKSKFNPESMRFPIMLTGLDNMAARKQCFDAWKVIENREIFIDGRMRANLYEIYVVYPGMEEEYEKTLFSDSEVADGPCTFKQTTYVGMLIGARITQVMVNHFTNKYAKEPICVVPFKIQEFTEPFFIKIDQL
jgi:molybdopterin/thiamine biosynthesis adenylyltransferase